MWRYLVFTYCCLLVPLLASAQSDPLERKATVLAEGQELESVLVDLVEKQGLPLVFRNDLIPRRRVTVRFQQQPLRIILDALLTDTELRYRTVGNLVLLEERPPPTREFILSGFVSDATTGERLIGATVIDLESRRGIYTDEYGFYKLRLPYGKAAIRVSYTGYSTYEQTVDVQQSQQDNINLVPSLTLNEIVVTATDSVTLTDKFRFTDSAIGLSAQRAEQMPSLAGESDIMRLAHFEPGIQTGTDGAEGLHIRGGEAGQNLVLIDGVPIYNVDHAIGLFSIFNSAAIRQATLYKDGFPARYGGRLSGVLDIRTKEGNLKRWQGQVSAGLLTARAQIEGPLVKDRTAIFVSARQSFIDTYLGPASRQLKLERGQAGATRYNFYDVNAKLQHILGNRDRLYASFYQGRDNYADQTEATETLTVDVDNVVSTFQIDQFFRERIRWGNTAASLRWNHMLGNRMVVNTSLHFSRLTVLATNRQDDQLTLVSTAETSQAENYISFRTAIRDVGGLVDVHYPINDRHDLRFGLQQSQRDFTPGVLQLDVLPSEVDTFRRTRPILGNETSFYLEHKWQPVRPVQVSWGGRLGRWRSRTKAYWEPQLRLRIDWRIRPKWHWHGSAGQMVQFLHRLPTANIGLPTDLWIPATDLIRPARSWQYATGLAYKGKSGWHLGVNTYYKEMDDLLLFSEGADPSDNIEQNVTHGTGLAKGVEFLVRYSRPKVQAQVAYTLASSNRQFPNINQGNRYPHKYDRRHNVALLFSHRLRPWLIVNANWQFSTGFAFTLPLEKYEILPDVPITDQFVFPGDKNSVRMPVYHRFDIGLCFKWGNTRRQHQLTAGLYNAYNRRNPLYIDLRARYIATTSGLGVRREIIQVWLAPLLPSLSYTFSLL